MKRWALLILHKIESFLGYCFKNSNISFLDIASVLSINDVTISVSHIASHDKKSYLPPLIHIQHQDLVVVSGRNMAGVHFVAHSYKLRVFRIRQTLILFIYILLPSLVIIWKAGRIWSSLSITIICAFLSTSGATNFLLKPAGML